MAFITVSDESYEIEAVVFPEVYRSRNILLVGGSIVELLVKQTERNGQKQLIVNDIKTLDLEATIQQLFIKVTPELANNSYNQIREIIKGMAGALPIILHVEKCKTNFS